ncbi:late embryogenesis abundant protein At1g64065-like [Humulus lupulus]|uniref:late embryogenesis abundant protein At1g64065-like n=1 Tax=Humulus lupulus TaxID=3486 RepID=UPI002B4009F8|nr:late embryogenesis abundant protein At1g64065-like [Humulus lupulus]
MAEKTHQTTKEVPKRNDEESATTTTSSSQEFNRQKRRKIFQYIAIFIVFQIIVISVFVLVVMRVKSPKVTLSDVDLQSLKTATLPSPTFDVVLGAEVRIKNSNFGPYKFEDGVVSFTYEGIVVGQVLIPKGKVGMKSTKEVDVTVSLSSANLAGFGNNNLGSELSAGVLTLSSITVMKGKVELMGIIKKNKAAEMNCFLAFDLPSNMLRTLDCQ